MNITGSLNRIIPNMPAEAYATYRVLAPISTHWIPATCEQVSCLDFLSGFRIDIDEATELGQRQAHFIRHDKTRSCAETRTETGLTRFTYQPGNKCFSADQHKRQVRPDRFLVDGGDWRGNPRGIARREHTRAEFWIEDFAENQDRLKTLIERG